LLDRVADQTIPPASPYVGNNLLPNAFIKNDEILVFCIIKSHQARPVSTPTYPCEFTCFRPRWVVGYQQYLRCWYDLVILSQPQATALPALGRDESAPHFEAAGASGAFWRKRLFNQSLNGFSWILPA
jgi:hypothetical protein